MAKIPVIVAEGPTPLEVTTLWERVGRSFESIDQFLLALDILYVLGRLDLDMASGLVTYVD